MTAFYPHTENLLVPLAGICILLVLGLAAYMEPKKDYSRRIYLFMGISPFKIGVLFEGGNKKRPFSTKRTPSVLLGQKSETSAVPPKLAISRPLGDVPSHAFPW